jgi:heterodisulfide reductase subunit C
MGLDSIALVVTVENTFGIKIPDEVCENIATVGQMVDAVYERIQRKPNQKCLSQIVFYTLRNALIQFGNDRSTITLETKMCDLLSKTELAKDWLRLQQKLQWKLPELVALDTNKNLKKEFKIFGVKLFDRTDPIAENTLRNFTHWIISLNFDSLISMDEISSKYEIERIICGITEDQTGVPISEIQLHHSFTYDLGID